MVLTSLRRLLLYGLILAFLCELLGGCSSSAAQSGHAQRVTPMTEAEFEELLQQARASQRASKTFPLRRCLNTEFESEHSGPWNSGYREEIANSGPASHWFGDVVTGPRGKIKLDARLAYHSANGTAVLNREWVRIYLGTCEGWQLVGHQQTDSGGWTSLDLRRSLPVGIYEAVVQVVGDLSVVKSTIWVIPRNTPVVLVSVAGTIVPREQRQVSNEPAVVTVPHEGSAELTREYAKRGYTIIYIAEAGDFYAGLEVEAWLKLHQFAPGPILRQPPADDPKLGNPLPAEFKTQVIEDLITAGAAIKSAYGSSISDIHAFTENGIEPQDIWLFGARRGNVDYNLVDDSWSSRLDDVELLPELDLP